MITIGISLDDYTELANVKKLCNKNNVNINLEKDLDDYIFLEISGYSDKCIIVQNYIEKINRNNYYKNTWLGKIFNFIK
jgi:hypothetical protein